MSIKVSTVLMVVWLTKQGLEALICHANNAAGEVTRLVECGTDKDLCFFYLSYGQVNVGCAASAHKRRMESIYSVSFCSVNACNLALTCKQCPVGQMFCAKEELEPRMCQSLSQIKCGIVRDASRSNWYWGGCLNHVDIENMQTMASKLATSSHYQNEKSSTK